ncbi:myogenesis-regulating glycosidase-like [Brevipalpus obovatus]|uniref:myogenesis-regulating glycosidase-like n=1 Tax=Brevipalpus obovatus TaxID=246614 RepID=UPI003D9DBFCC
MDNSQDINEPLRIKDAGAQRRTSSISSSEMSNRRGSTSTVLQLADDSTWKEANHQSSPIDRRRIPIGRFGILLEMYKKPEFNFRLSIALLFVCIIILIASTSLHHQQTELSTALKYRIVVSETPRHVYFLNPLGRSLAKVHYGNNMPPDVVPFKCLPQNPSKYSVCRDWNFRALLRIDYEEVKNNVSCYHVSWKSYSHHEVLQDCIDLADGLWLGMGQTSSDVPRPLNGWNLNSTPYVSDHRINNQLFTPLTDFFHDPSEPRFRPFGPILKRYWLSSAGFTIQVPLSIPLWVSFNSTGSGRPDGLLCLEARTDKAPYKPYELTPPHLNYTICSGPNLTVTHTENARRWVASDKSEGIINTTQQSMQVSLIDKPIWYIDEKIMPTLQRTKLESYINKTIDFGPLPGILLIDTKWQKNMGDLEIDKSHFGDPSKIFTGVKRRGFKIMFAVAPLVQLSSPTFGQDTENGRIFRDKRLMTPLITHCKPKMPRSKLIDDNFMEIYLDPPSTSSTTAVDMNGTMSSNNTFTTSTVTSSLPTVNTVKQPSYCAVFDLYNSTTRQWFTDRLLKLANKSINGLMLKGFPVSRMPRFLLDANRTGLNPDGYQYHWRKVASSFDLIGLDTFVDPGVTSGFLRIGKLPSTWESLRTIIPTVLSIGLIGHPLVNTGSVGGDIMIEDFRYKPDSLSDNLSDYLELYSRWMELAAFLPIIQFSKVPDEDQVALTKLVKRYMKIRDHQIVPRLKSCMKEYIKDGLPIIRPIWWLDPTVVESYSINDQFAICNDTIVAPILHKNSTDRDIYLPDGWWRDEINGQTIRGGKWMRNYGVELNRIAYFSRTKEELA